jgi:cobalt-zinc-cadmium efflux system outer membrane protein
MQSRSPLFSLLFSSLLLSPALLRADTVHLTLSSAPAYALKHNPDLAAARLRIAEAQGRLAQSGRLSNPEFEFDYSKNPRSSERNVGVAFNQKFPLTARLRQEKTLSQHQLAQAGAEVRDQERKLVAEVHAAAIKLMVAEQKRVLVEAQIKSSATLLEAVEKRTQAGEIAPTDAAQLAIDNQNRLLELQQSQVQKAVLLGELKPLLGVTSERNLDLDGALPPIASATKKADVTGRPDLQSSRIGESVAQSEVDLAKSSRWEDIGVGLTFEHERAEDAPDGISGDGFVGFRISLPLPLWNKQKGLIAEKEAAQQRAILETRALEAKIKGEAAAARGEMAASAKLHAEVHSNLIPTIAKHSETIEKAYNKGEADLMSLLRSREQKLHAETVALEALRDYHLAKARFEAATATQPALRSR